MPALVINYISAYLHFSSQSNWVDSDQNSFLTFERGFWVPKVGSAAKSQYQRTEELPLRNQGKEYFLFLIGQNARVKQ